MKRINKVLLLFVLLASAFFWILWRGVQTERFGEYLSNRIKKTVQEKTNLKISFERIDISLIPPATTMRSFEVFDKATDTRLKANYLGMSFGLTDLISPTLSIGEVFLDDAVLVSKGKTEKKEKEPFKINTIFSQYKDFYNDQLQVRIKKINIKNTEIEVDDYKFEVREFSTSLFSDLVTSKGIVETVKLKSRNEILLDQLEYELQLSEGGLRVKQLNLMDGISRAELVGKVELTEEVDLNLLFKYDGGKNLKGLSLLKEIPQEVEEIDASINIDGKILGSVKKPVVEGTVKLTDLISEFVLLDELVVSLGYKSDLIILDSVDVKVGGGAASLKLKKPVFNIKTKDILTKTVLARARNLHSNDFLYAIKEDLNPLKLRYTGEVKIHYLPEGIRFEPLVGSKITNARLLDKKEQEIIIQPKSDIVWKSGEGITVFFESGVFFDGNMMINESDLSLRGKIDDYIDLNTVSENISLEDIGPIAGTELFGRGMLNMKIYGPPEDVYFNTDYKIKDFNVIELNLGEIEGEALLGLEDLKLSLDIKKGKFISSAYEGRGELRFEGDDNLSLQTNILYGSYDDIEKMAPNIFKAIEKYAKPLSSTIQGTLNVYGGFRKDLLGVKGSIRGSGKYQKELIDSYRMSFNYQKEQLTLSNILLKKSRGHIAGTSFFDFVQDKYNYSFDVNGLNFRDLQNVNDLGLGYDGILSGKISGGGIKENVNSKIDLKITNGKIGEYEVADSIISMHRSSEEYFIRSNIFQGEFVIDSILDFSERKNKKSKLNLKVDTMDLRKLLGVLSLHNLDDREMSGALKLFVDADFDAKNVLGMNASAKIDFFRWYKKNELLEIDNPMAIKIVNGVVKQWDLKTSSLSRNSFKMTGEGNLTKKVKIDSDFKISCVFADVLTEKLNFRDGDLFGRLRIIGEEGRFSTYLDLSGEKITLKPINLRTPLNDLNFSLILDGEKININSFESKLGGGTLLASGNGRLKFPYPELKIFLEGKNIRQPLFKKSYFIFDSTLTLEGDDLPYDVVGKANVKTAVIRDELKDMKDDSLINQGYRKYIPKVAADNERAPLNLAIEAVIGQPLSVKNSLLDINLTGRVNLSNTLKNTLYSGKVDLAKDKNLLFLKGHEFLFTEGEIELVPIQEEQKINLNFLASSKINEYDVFTDIKGTTDDLIVDMYSQPNLSQGDLLSLVTLGVTSDVSQNLGEKERQSVTTLGLGGIVLDQLGINQNLNKSFGLKVSVAPEIEEDDGSLLRGRTENAGSETSMKTGTKIQVKKELADKVDLSLSSTVGGAAKQKQEMNVDVKINEAFSLEGVYEMRSTDELEEENPDSIGADLKWRFSF